MSRIADWIFSIRLTGDMNIAGKRNGKIRLQDTRRKAVAVFWVWIHTLRMPLIPRYRRFLRTRAYLQNLCNLYAIFSFTEYSLWGCDWVL